MKRKIILFLCLFAVIFSFWFWNSSKKAIDSNESISVGMMSGWAPFMSVNAQGGFEGFDVDVALELGKRLGKPVEILDAGSLASLFISLEKNKIDMAFSGLDITQDRLKKMHMIPYTGEALKEYHLLFWDEIPSDIKGIEDLKKHSNPVVVVEPGVSGEKYLDQFDYIIKKSVASLPERLLDVQYKKSLALFLEPSIARMIVRKNPQFKALPVELPAEFHIYGMGIAVKQSNTALAESVKKAIDAMKADGTLKKIEDKWQLGDEPDDV